MPEPKNEEQTSENAQKTEKTKEPKVESKKSESPAKETKKEIEAKEPPKRFPPKEQNPLEKQIGYLTRKLEKLEKEKQAPADANFDNDFADEDEEPVTRKELNELLEKQQKASASQKMVDDFLNGNPDYRKIEKRLRKYVEDPDYSNIPIGFIASGIIGENLDEEANARAKAKIKADREAEKTKSGGSIRRGIPGKKKDIWSMTPEEFESYQAEVLQKGRE